MKKAFTLAEVLITLSIVGLIAALTVPSLVKNYKNKLYSASIEKTYSLITNAVQEVMNDEYTSEFYKTTAGVIADKDTDGNAKNCASATAGSCWFLRNYFDVAKGTIDCNSASYNRRYNTQKAVCVADKYTSPKGEGSMVHFGNCIQTNNGATICMSLNSHNGVTSIFVDTNGPSQPNFTGVDAFVMSIDASSGKVRDWSTDSTKCNTQSNNYGHAADYAVGCLTKVMNAGWKIED